MAERIDPDMAAELMRAAGLEPLEQFDDPDQPWRCRCLTCSRVVTPRLSSIGAGEGCKYCATTGLDLNAPGIVFVATHEERNAHVLGFDAADGGRTDRLTQFGWQVFKTASVPTVEDSYMVRAAVLRWLRLELLLPACLSPAGAPDEQREGSVSADAVDPADIWARVSSELSRRRRRRRAAGGARSSHSGSPESHSDVHHSSADE